MKYLIKKTFLYPIYLSLYFKLQKRKSLRNNLIEIKKRIAADDLLKDWHGDELAEWEYRINTVLSSPDNSKINSCKDGGTLKGNYLIMHNGLKIDPLSYYGYPLLKMMLQNRSIHEPQEEFVFQEVLKEMPHTATMLELGAYWSYYSMWFNKKVDNPINYMIEPENIQSGINNFKLNRLKGYFFQYFISDHPSINEDGSETISVDSFVEKKQIGFIDILHSDIQGYEYLMLQGATRLLSEKKIGYVFISTHSNELHQQCKEFMDALNFIMVCSANIDESYSHDGLLVYKNPAYKGIEKVEISLRDN